MKLFNEDGLVNVYVGESRDEARLAIAVPKQFPLSLIWDIMEPLKAPYENIYFGVKATIDH